MKVFKKLLAVVLSLAMVLGTLTVTALGAVTEISDADGLATALSTGGEYKVTKNITSLDKNALSVASGVNVTIDLNGYKVTRNSAGTLGTIAGTLTIKDTSANASGIFGQASTTATTAATVLTVSGKLNLESGTLKIGSGKAKNAKLLLNTGKINISGGTITGTTLTSEATNGQMISNSGTINMTGGSITGNDVSAANRRIIQNNKNTAFMYLEGGEISGNTVGTGQDIYLYDGSVHIYGNMKINGVLGSDSGEYFNITSGMFNAMPNSKYIVEGYEAVELTTKEKTANPGYNYKVQVIPAGPTVAKIGDTEYDDVDKALKACKDDEIILLVADCESDILTYINTRTTIDLNGYTLKCARTEEASSARLANVSPTGVLTIVDSSAGTPGMIIAPANCAHSGAIAYANGGKVFVYAGRFQEGASGQPVFDKGISSETSGSIEGILEIYGGYYTDVSKAGLDNYVKGSDASKAYSIVKDTTYPGFGWTVGEAVVDVDGTKYASFDAAIAAAAVEGSPLKLLKDATASKEFSEEITFTVDKNGFTWDLNSKITVGDGYQKFITEKAGIYTVAITVAPTTPFKVGDTEYATVEALHTAIANGTIEEDSTIILTGMKPDGTIVLDGKDMTIDGSGIVTGIVLPDNGVLVSATDKARVNVLGTMPTTGKEDTADAPIYSEGFIYLGASASSKTLTTTGSVYQAKTVAEFMTAGATLTESIALSVSAEVAPKTGDVIAIATKEGTASATTINKTTGFYEATISGIYLSHVGNDLGLSVKANDTAVESLDDYTTVDYLSAAATANGTKDAMKTLIANLIIACKNINEVGEGNKGADIDLTATKLSWIESAKTTEAPATKSMTISTLSDSDKIRFAAAGLHVTEKLNVFVKIDPRKGATTVPKGTYIKAYINDGNGYEEIAVTDASVYPQDSTQWYAYIDKIAPTQYGSDIKIELYTDKDVLTQTLTYSVNTYCSQMSTQYADLCTAIYNYGTAAKAVAEAK